MRRVSVIILSVILLFSTTACAFTDMLSGNNEEYVPSADIAVAVTHVAEKAKVVTRRTSDEELSGVELICVYFDAQGKQLGKYERVKCSFSTKGNLSIWTFAAPEGCVYMASAIAAVTYADGIESACPGATTWAKETARAFTVEEYEKSREEMEKSASVAAQVCDALEYAVDTPEESVLPLKLKNISGKEISNVVACLLWFDADGAPIDVGGILVANSEKVSAKDLAIDKEVSYTVHAPAGAASAKAIIEEVTFADGSVWENEYLYEWSVLNWDTAK